MTAGWRNSIHRDDDAGALAHFLTADVACNETVLVSDGTPVDRWAFADLLAAQWGVAAPEKLTVEERLQSSDLSDTATLRVASQKRCRNDRLRSLGYEPRSPSVYPGYEPAVDVYRRDERA